MNHDYVTLVNLFCFCLEAPRHFYLRGPLILLKGLNILDNLKHLCVLTICESLLPREWILLSLILRLDSGVAPSLIFNGIHGFALSFVVACFSHFYHFLPFHFMLYFSFIAFEFMLFFILVLIFYVHSTNFLIWINQSSSSLEICEMDLHI